MFGRTSSVGSTGVFLVVLVLGRLLYTLWGIDTNYLGFMMNLGRGNMMYRTKMFYLPRRPRSREGGAEPYFGGTRGRWVG